jgi:hypothetical protein
VQRVPPALGECDRGDDPAQLTVHSRLGVGSARFDDDPPPRSTWKRPIGSQPSTASSGVAHSHGRSITAAETLAGT